MEIIFVNSLYSQDAGPPIIPTDFIYRLATLSTFEASFYDLNLEMYKEQKYEFRAYNLLKMLFGGYIGSFEDAEIMPFNEYSFEALPTLELLLAMIFNEDSIEKELNIVCNRYGIPYHRALQILIQFKGLLKLVAEKICIADVVVINQPSPASVFAALLLGCYLRRLNPKITIIGLGNQINVPEVAELALALKALDKIVTHELFSIKNALTEIESSPELLTDIVPDFTKISSEDYPLFHGLKIAPYEASNGCPCRCNFCSERLFWDYKGNIQDNYIKKPLKNVLNEIDTLSNGLTLSGVTLNDCMLNAESEYSKEFFAQLASKNLLFSGSARIDTLDERMIELLLQAHFTNLIVGLETVSDDSVKVYNKGGKNYSRKAWEVIPLLYNTGIIPQINLLIAHPYESLANVENSLQATIEFAKYLDSQGIPFYDISAGQIIINYPSETYFKVMEDPEFNVIYHRVPEILKSIVPDEVARCVGKIPFIAIKKVSAEESNYNKNEMCMQISALESKDHQKIVSFKVAGLAKHRDLILNSWRKRDVFIHYLQGESSANDLINSPVGSIVRQLILNQNITINELIQSIDNGAKDVLVETLLSLSMMGIVDFSGGDVK